MARVLLDAQELEAVHQHQQEHLARDQEQALVVVLLDACMSRSSHKYAHLQQALVVVHQHQHEHLAHDQELQRACSHCGSGMKN